MDSQYRPIYTVFIHFELRVIVEGDNFGIYLLASESNF